MTKSEFFIRAAVANMGGAMEADTISKHGRSSKSHTSRGNIWIKTCFAVFMACFISIGANAQDFCNAVGDRIEFYPTKSFGDGGDVQLMVAGNFVKGQYQVKPPKSYDKFAVVEFFDDGKTKPVLFGKYFRAETDSSGRVRKKAYIEILGEKLELCPKLKKEED